MTAEAAGWLTVLGMFAVTYAARAGGYLALRERRPGPWLAEFLRLAPLTLFAAMVVPRFAAARDGTELGVLLAAALLVLVVVRTRAGIPGALFAGVAAVAGLRALLG